MDDMIHYRCQCSHSFKIPYDKDEPLDSFIINLAICDGYFEGKGGKIGKRVIEIDVDTGKEIFTVKFLSEQLSLLDNAKYFNCNYIPDFIFLPKEQLMEKLYEFLTFI